MREFYTTGQVGRICGISITTVIRYCDGGKIRCVRSPVTGVRRISRDSLLEFMKAHEVPEERLWEFEKPRIFIVDDDRPLVEIMLRSLKGLETPCDFQASTSGYAALIRMGAFSPDLVVLDLMMPGMNGFELCRAIRATPETRDARILVVTGYATPENARKAADAGADKMIQKPIQVDKFKETVTALLRSQLDEEG